MSEVRMILMKAIAGQMAVSARYNGGQIKLAPHLMFERHGDLFVSAENMSKNRQPDDERRLGQFKLAGLSATEVLDEAFAAIPEFQPAPPRPGDVVILAV